MIDEKDIPDFGVWAHKLTMDLPYNSLYIEDDVRKALACAFAHGYDVGKKSVEEWWEQVDADTTYMMECGTLESQLTDFQIKNLQRLTKDVIINLDEPLPEEE